MLWKSRSIIPYIRVKSTQKCSLGEWVESHSLSSISCVHRHAASAEASCRCFVAAWALRPPSPAMAACDHSAIPPTHTSVPCRGAVLRACWVGRHGTAHDMLQEISRCTAAPSTSDGCGGRLGGAALRRLTAQGAGVHIRRGVAGGAAHALPGGAHALPGRSARRWHSNRVDQHDFSGVTATLLL